MSELDATLGFLLEEYSIFSEANARAECLSAQFDECIIVRRHGLGWGVFIPEDLLNSLMSYESEKENNLYEDELYQEFLNKKMQLGEELTYIKSTSDFKLSLEDADRFADETNSFICIKVGLFGWEIYKSNLKMFNYDFNILDEDELICISSDEGEDDDWVYEFNNKNEEDDIFARVFGVGDEDDAYESKGYFDDPLAIQYEIDEADRYVRDVKSTYLGLLSCSDETGWPYEDEDNELDSSRIWQDDYY